MKKILPIVSFFLLFSCSEEILEVEEHKATVSLVENQLFNAHFFIDERQKSVSFPIWFNDTIIKNKGISSISLQSINLSSLAQDTSLILEEKTFKFDPKGWVNQYRHNAFVDEIEAHDVVFNYKKGTSEHGYSLPTVNFSSHGFSIKSIQSLAELVEEIIDYDFYSIEEESNHFLRFKNKIPRDIKHLTYIISPSRQNVTHADELIKDYGESFIVFGSANQPTERFVLKNLVEKENNIKYDYHENSSLLNKIVSKKQNYYVVKQFYYNENGLFDHWKATKYANDQDAFEQTTFTVIYDEATLLPERIDIKNGAVEGEKRLIQQIQCKYNYF